MIKPGVKLYGLKPEMGIIHSEVKSIFSNYGVTCTITSGKRNSGNLSMHEIGYALDYRAKHIVESAQKRILHELKTALPQCDIILHGEGDNIHFHIEFDPKDDAEFQRRKTVWKQGGEW